MEKDSKLSGRKQQILISSIEDYIDSASPITSGNLHENHLTEVSSATLRNELSALEAMGYFKKLHTSGGRIPTTMGYRYFVNELMKSNKFSGKGLKQVRSSFNKKSEYVSDIVSSIATEIAKATNYPAVVVMHGLEKLIIDSIQIIPLLSGEGLVLITTNSGVINNTIKLKEATTEDICKDAANYLTNHFKGNPISDMILNIKSHNEELQEGLKNYSDIFNNLIDCLVVMNDTSRDKVLSTGQTKLLLSPEYTDLEKAKKVITVLEDKDALREIFEENEGEEITFCIGTENENENLEDCTVIKTNYSVNGESVASVGIIGPKRMNYKGVASALHFILKEFNSTNLLENKKGEDNGKK